MREELCGLRILGGFEVFQTVSHTSAFYWKRTLEGSARRKRSAPDDKVLFVLCFERLNSLDVSQLGVFDEAPSAAYHLLKS